MIAKQLADGSILVPKRAEGPSGEVGDGFVRVAPGDPGYEQALADLERDRRLTVERDRAEGASTGVSATHGNEGDTGSPRPA